MEAAVVNLSTIYEQCGRHDDLAQLVVTAREVLATFSKAKGAKVLRQVLDRYLNTDASGDRKVVVCQDCIDWARAERRTFLRQQLQGRLISLHLANAA